MKNKARITVRRSLRRAGRWLGPRWLQKAQATLSYLEMGHWEREYGKVPAYDQREQLYDLAIAEIASAKEPLYLEFGVWAGESMRWWSEHLKTPGAHLVGFDSFEGLPMAWKHGYDEGRFDVGGQPPAIDDERISWQVGWFSDTLPGFHVPEHDRLVINFDADLYTSTVEVFEALEKHIVPGTVMYFDEFNDRDAEPRALREFLAKTKLKVKPLGVAQGGIRWVFVVV